MVVVSAPRSMSAQPERRSLSVSTALAVTSGAISWSAMSAQIRQGCLHQKHHAFNVDVHHRIKICFRKLLQTLLAIKAGAVYQNIQLPVRLAFLLGNLCHCSLAFSLLRHVTGNIHCLLSCLLLQITQSLRTAFHGASQNIYPRTIRQKRSAAARPMPDVPPLIATQSPSQP